MAEGKLKCSFEGCNRSFSRPFNLNRHIEKHHENNTFSENCLLCGKIFTQSDKLQEHLIIDHGPSEKFYINESAFHGVAVKYRYNYKDEPVSFNQGQSDLIQDIKQTIRFDAAKKTIVKVSLVYICQMSMTSIEGEKLQTTLIPFRGSSFVTNALKNSGLTNKIKKSFREQEVAMEEFCACGSNWEFDRAVAYDIEIVGIKPIVMGGSYVRNMSESDMETLNIRRMKNKLHLFNPKNTDNKCFLRCLYFLIHPKVSYKVWEKMLNLRDIKFPIHIKHVKKFIKQNPKLNITVNVLYRTLMGQIFPFECGIGNGNKTINLLMVDTSNGSDTFKRHFLGIKNIHKYLSNTYIAGKKTSWGKSLVCVRCFNKFSMISAFKKHENYCSKNKAVVEYARGGKISFRHFENKHLKDFVAFLDFECVLDPTVKTCENCSSLRCKCDKSFSEIINHQEPFAFCFVVIHGKNKVLHEYNYIGENAADVLIDHLIFFYDKCLSALLNSKVPMNMTSEDKEDFINSNECYLCEKTFEKGDENDQNLNKCRDHDHYTGAYLGAACQSCNINRKRQLSLPIFIHNGSRYDFHFIIRALNGKDVGDIRVIPFNGEHFRTISFRGYKLVDTLAFLQSSLAQLSEDLRNTSHNYEILKQTDLVKTGSLFDDKKFEAILGKSFFPYEYCTSLEKMKNTLTLPERSLFYSSLNETCISKKDYKFATRVWKMFNCHNLLDYAQIYCKIDTFLLAEIFQKFRVDMTNFGGLDPAHYISLPAFSFDVMLKMTKCELDELHDIDMVHFFEAAIRGGISFINTRHLKVEDPAHEEIVYIDANVSHIQIIPLIYIFFINSHV